jgi:hypothetical protein
VAWTRKTWVGTCVGARTGGKELMLEIVKKNQEPGTGADAGAGSGPESVHGMKNNLRSKQTHKGALDPEVNGGTSLWPAHSG